MQHTYKEHALYKFKGGFTLVELAIVITIIGLLIGGVLKGQEMVQNARVTATIAQVKSYQAAVETFRDKYDQWPGDLSVALTRLPGCTATNSCYSGDGNSRVGNPFLMGGTAWWNLPQAGTDAQPAVETSMFFKHLALADLISGVNPAASVFTPEWGQTHPSAPFGGGFTVYYAARAGDVGTGHVLSLRNGLMENALQPTGRNAIAPIYGQVIDKKMDDGFPDAGRVQADAEGTNCDNRNPATNRGEYQPLTAKNCIMFFSVF